jgi:site-specific DNA recombinase
MVPLGYVSRDKKLVIEEKEAEAVRTIFRRYLELGSIGPLLTNLRERGIVTKVRHLREGRTGGGIPFTRGPLAYLLRNRFYIGEIDFKGEICPAEHPPIVETCSRRFSTGLLSSAILSSGPRIFERRVDGSHLR